MSKCLMGIWVVWVLVLPWIQLSATAADFKVAVVSMERVFDEYHKTKEANARFKACADELDVKRRNLVADVKSRKSELEALSLEARDKSLSDAEREKKKLLEEEKYARYRDAEDKLLEFDKSCKKQFGDQMRQMQQQIVMDIRAVIQAYVKDRGITMVFDSSGKTMNNVEAIIYFDKALDITDAIIALLNKDKPVSSSKPEPASRK